MLEGAVAHAMQVTEGDRNLFLDESFLRLSRSQKQRFMQEKIEEWIKNHWFHVRSPMLASQRGGRAFALPAQFVPFAKIDHLAIQVLQLPLLSL